MSNCAVVHQNTFLLQANFDFIFGLGLRFCINYAVMLSQTFICFRLRMSLSESLLSVVG